jgi:hypothetical protein
VQRTCSSARARDRAVDPVLQIVSWILPNEHVVHHAARPSRDVVDDGASPGDVPSHGVVAALDVSSGGDGKPDQAATSAQQDISASSPLEYEET